MRILPVVLLAAACAGVSFAPVARADEPSQPIARDRTVANRAPVWNTIDAERTSRLGDNFNTQFNATDPDGDPLSYTIAGLPAGAHVDREGTGIALRWHPEPDDVGSHEIKITASDGELTATQEFQLVVEDEYKTFVMPGLQYSGYLPNARSEFGAFHGASIELLLFAWIHRNENRGPSHGRIYVNLDVLSTTNGAGGLFSPVMGLDLSIERNPTRRFLLPYFGVETGALLSKMTGSDAILTPIGGLHLWASQNVFVNVSGGYLLPLDARDFDDLRGARIKAGLDFSAW